MQLKSDYDNKLYFLHTHTLALPPLFSHSCTKSILEQWKHLKVNWYHFHLIKGSVTFQNLTMAFRYNVLMINVPTELIKLHRTGPLEAMATSTLRMDLQQAVCILSLYWGKLSICTTRRRSSSGVYTSGIWDHGHTAGVQMRQSLGWD